VAKRPQENDEEATTETRIGLFHSVPWKSFGAVVRVLIHHAITLGLEKQKTFPNLSRIGLSPTFYSFCLAILVNFFFIRWASQ
jgi:hypothetical protein